MPLFLARKFPFLARDAYIKSHTAEKKSLADTEDFQGIKQTTYKKERDRETERQRERKKEFTCRGGNLRKNL